MRFRSRETGPGKGIFGIRDLTKIRCGNRENDKYIDGIRDLTVSLGSGTRRKFGTGCGIYVCMSFGMSETVMSRRFKGPK